MKENQFLKHFSPMWFAVSMGIGGFANVLLHVFESSDIVKLFVWILVVINIIFFTSFLVPWIIRWFTHYDDLSKDLKHPIFSNFFVTMPVALMILATNIMNVFSPIVEKDKLMIFIVVLWIIGAILTIVFSVATTFNMMMKDSIHPEMTNFAWFISPVANILVPLLGNNVAKYYIGVNIDLAHFINFINLSFFGIGIVLFFILGGIIFNRFLFHKMPGSMVLPSFYIMLGPIAIGTISLMGLASVNVSLGLLDSVKDISIIAILLWGFGFWALGLLLSLTIMYIKKDKITFSLSWWAFIFPVSAYVLATMNVYHYLHYEFIHVFAYIITVILSVLFVVTFAKTVKGIVLKTLFQPIHH